MNSVYTRFCFSFLLLRHYRKGEVVESTEGNAVDPEALATDKGSGFGMASP